MTDAKVTKEALEVLEQITIDAPAVNVTKVAIEVLSFTGTAEPPVTGGRRLLIVN
jgi:hypothetical protein